MLALAFSSKRPEALDGIDLGGQLRQNRRLIAAAGADFEGLAQRGRPLSSSSIMRATTKGWEMVCPKPRGSAVSS